MSSRQDSRVHALFVRLVTSGLLLIGTAAVAGALFATGFEAPDYNGSSDGVVVAGQQGWYVPSVAGSVDQFIFTYDNNALGVKVNAGGEDQFLGSLTPDVGSLPRAQLDFDWSQATVWTVTYDIAVGYNGIPPASDFIGSFSLQDSTVARYFIALESWVNPDTADQWNSTYAVFNADGTMVDLPGLSPGAAWRNLAVNHWYNLSVTFDFDSNTITSVSITDLDSGDTATFEPTGWYLAGGATFRPPLPTALRFFVGGDATPGNFGAFDNLAITAVSGAAPNPGVSTNAQGNQIKPGPATN